MQNKACNNGAEQFPTAEFSSAEEAVTALITTENLKKLARVAEKRLARLASQPPGQRLRGLQDPAELVNQAILLVATGERRACGRHLKNLNAFYNYIQSIIQSVITHELERITRQGEQVSLNAGSGGVEPVTTTDVVWEVALQETRTSLFSRLREYGKSNPTLLKAINVWDQSWLSSDRIPKCGLSDKQVHALRIKSREILRQNAVRDGVARPNSRECLDL